MDILVTKRLTLRPPLEVDAEAISNALQNPKISRMLTSVPSPYVPSDALEWINKCGSERDALHFCIYRQNLLGVVSVRPNAKGKIDLGYWLDEPVWGNGFMTEAARATLSYAFTKLGCNEIESGAYQDNPASLAVLEKLGFEPTGEATHSNVTRKCDVICKRSVLSKTRFEQMFGPLEGKEAA